MTHLGVLLFGSEEVFGSFGLWAFLTISAVALFAVFIPLVTWMENRRKERDAFYKSEMIRRVAEASGDGAKATVELLKKHGFDATFHESPGAHTWINWRNYLNEFAPQLF